MLSSIHSGWHSNESRKSWRNLAFPGNKGSAEPSILFPSMEGGWGYFMDTNNDENFFWGNKCGFCLNMLDSFKASVMLHYAKGCRHDSNQGTIVDPIQSETKRDLLRYLYNICCRWIVNCIDKHGAEYLWSKRPLWVQSRVQWIPSIRSRKLMNSSSRSNDGFTLLKSIEIVSDLSHNRRRAPWCLLAL